MPVNVVHTLEDEEAWERAKEIAANEYPEATGSKVEYTGAGGTPVYKKTLSEMIGIRARSRLFEMCRVVAMPAVEDYRIKTAR